MALWESRTTHWHQYIFSKSPPYFQFRHVTPTSASRPLIVLLVQRVRACARVCGWVRVGAGVCVYEKFKELLVVQCSSAMCKSLAQIVCLQNCIVLAANRTVLARSRGKQRRRSKNTVRRASWPLFHRSWWSVKGKLAFSVFLCV